jgi:hypothetical protein
MTALSGQRAALNTRTAERFPVNAGAACAFAMPVVEEAGSAKVLNVSIEGVGLRLARRVELGALLAVGLTNPARGFSKTVLVRVTRVTAEISGCVVGGTFLTPLTYQEMTTLVL